jgi:GT2 family glycosyltransferase
VSVVVVTFGRQDLLERCLDSLRRQAYRDFEVVVVDNGSPDGTLAYLRGLGRPGLAVVPLPENRGFAGGCNAGIAAARGRYVATLNNDAEADPAWLGELVGALEADPAAGMCASKILSMADRRTIDKVGHIIYWDGVSYGRGSGETDAGQYDRPEEVLLPDAAAALYRRELLDAVGGFDERYFAYCDDCDLGLRGRLAGWSCRYVPTAVVRHVHSATAGEHSVFKAFLIERNRIWTLVKTFPLPLVLASPLFTAARLAFHSYGAMFGVGVSGKFAREGTRLKLVGAILAAYASAARGLPAMWRARRAVRRYARLTGTDFVRLLWRHRSSLRALTLRP